MLCQYIALCVCQCVSQKKIVFPFVGLHCGCVLPFENMCVRSLGYIVGASPPRVCPFFGSLHAAYSALRHFSFRSHTCVERVVEFFPLFLNEKVWESNLFLKVLLLNPVYVFTF